MSVAWPAPDPSSPYFCHGPTLISFSGGRTSAYMLHEVLRAHGGALPAYVHVCFANTGKERKETLRFVHECANRWGVRIRWLEWRSRLKSVRVADRFEEVRFNSAARQGEPFKALVRSKSSTPNAMARWCTEHLKVQILGDFMVAHNYSTWVNMVGLRADEMHRVMKKAIQNASGDLPWVTACPMALVGVTRRVIRLFWNDQPFDLGTEDGNCDNCFLKARARLVHNLRQDPTSAADWMEMETLGKGRFVTEYSFAQLLREADASPEMEGIDEPERDAECGTSCTGDDATEPLDDGAVAWIMDQLRKTQASPRVMPIAHEKVEPVLRPLL